jgi:hypothetical protein
MNAVRSLSMARLPMPTWQSGSGGRGLRSGTNVTPGRSYCQDSVTWILDSLAVRRFAGYAVPNEFPCIDFAADGSARIA